MSEPEARWVPEATWVEPGEPLPVITELVFERRCVWDPVRRREVCWPVEVSAEQRALRRRLELYVGPQPKVLAE